MPGDRGGLLLLSASGLRGSDLIVWNHGYFDDHGVLRRSIGIAEDIAVYAFDPVSVSYGGHSLYLFRDFMRKQEASGSGGGWPLYGMELDLVVCAAGRKALRGGHDSGLGDPVWNRGGVLGSYCLPAPMPVQSNLGGRSKWK